MSTITTLKKILKKTRKIKRRKVYTVQKKKESSCIHTNTLGRYITYNAPRVFVRPPRPDDKSSDRARARELCINTFNYYPLTRIYIFLYSVNVIRLARINLNLNLKTKRKKKRKKTNKRKHNIRVVVRAPVVYPT